jgi:hypothetical protein
LFVRCKKRLFYKCFRAVERLCTLSLRFHFGLWSSIVSDFKRRQIESLLVALEDEFSRMRIVHDENARHRQCLEQNIVYLEEEVVRLRNQGQSASEAASQTANLNQKYLQFLAQYDGWQKEFEGFLITDSAINRLRPHMKVPPAVPPGLLPGFVSPLRSHTVATSAVRSGSAFASPDRLISSHCDAIIDSSLCASVGRHSQVRRRGGGYDLDV